MNWSIKNVDGSLVGCGTQYTQVKVYAQASSSASDDKTGDPFTKMFDCATGTGTLELPTRGDAATGGFEAHSINGRYDVWISQTESSGELDRQLSPTTYRLDLAAGDKSVTTTLHENGGYRLVEWGFLAQGTGLSSPLVAGRYTFTLSAYSNNTLVGTGAPQTEQRAEDHSRVNTVHDHHFITITTR